LAKFRQLKGKNGWSSSNNSQGVGLVLSSIASSPKQRFIYSSEIKVGKSVGKTNSPVTGSKLKDLLIN
jgi:hypothetical protein